MKILELNITEFGALKDKKISLSDGLNIIEGDNESGKSTLVLFIKFMLYGLGRKSAKNIDRERALSFDGHRAAGSMKLEHGGTQYLIERRASSGAASKVTENLTLTDLTTGATLDGEPGEVLLGVPCEAFESSAYVSQAKAANVGEASAISAIQNMLVSADESIDVSKILERLDKVRKTYRPQRGEGGELHRTEQELVSLKIAQREASEKQLSAEEMGARLERLEQNIRKVSDSHTASKQMLDDLMNAGILRRFEELDAKSEHLEELKQEHIALTDKISLGGFVPDRAHLASLQSSAGVYATASEKLAKCKYDADSASPLDEQTLHMASVGEEIERVGGKSEFCRSASKHRKAASTLGILAALSLAAAGISAVFFYPIAIATGALAIVLFALSIVQSGKKNKVCKAIGVEFKALDAYADTCLASLAECRADKAKRSATIALYEAAKQDMSRASQALTVILSKTLGNITDGDVHTQATAECARIEAFCNQSERLQREIYAFQTLVATMQAELSVYDRDALKQAVKTDISTLTPEAVERARTKERFDRERLGELIKQQQTVREALIALRAGLTVSPVELADRISVLEEKLATDTRYYNALVLAKEHIEQASTSMTKDVTPELARRASDMIAIVSGGEHASMQTTKELSLKLEDGGFFIPSELLSGGTRDAAYICLRIALMYRMYGDDVPPLILDESLCQLDTTRTQRMLRLLAGLASGMQCILLTCHTREKEICIREEISAKHIDFSELM